MEQYGDLYTVIGMPATDPSSDIEEFIESGNVGELPHVLDTESLWADYGALGTPTWMTITASGKTTVGIGAFTRTLLNGEDWIDGL